MRNLLIVLYFILGIIIGSMSHVLLGQENGLNEVQKLQAQNHQLKLQLTQCQVSTAQTTLSAEQARLLDDFKKTLNPKEGQVFNWDSLKFEDKK